MEPEKKPRNPQLADKYVLRLPDGMRERINELAKCNNRSMNSEIVFMLQQVLDERAVAPAIAAGSIDVDALAEALAPRLAAKLREATT